ncbi:hypothetical protein [Oceanobacillus sp. CAU 1775]
MLKIIQIILTTAVISLSLYGLFTEDFTLFPHLYFLAGITFFVVGVRDIRKGQKTFGWVTIAISLFFVFMSIDTFLA